MSETPQWEAELVLDAHARLGEGHVFTTASPDEPAADQPHAGGLFRTRPGVTGLPCTPFAL